MIDLVKNKKYLLFIICAVIPFLVCFCVSSLPTFDLEKINVGTNFNSHTLRINGIWWSIQNKVFPHYINAVSNNFHGDADPIGYPYLFLYIPAILYNYLTMSASYNIYNMIINCFTFILMFIGTDTIFKNKKIAIISAILFTLSNYRLYDIYELSRIGEYTALMFYPLAIAGIYNIFFDDKKKWWLLTVAMCGNIFSHIISFYYLTILVTVLTAISIIINIVLYKKIDGIKYIFKATIWTILFSLWFVVPFLDYYLEKKLFFTNMGKDQLSKMLINLWIYDVQPDYVVLQNISLNDIILSVIIVVALFLIIKNIKDKILNRDNAQIKYIIIATFFFIIFIYYFLASHQLIFLQKIDLFIPLYGKQQFSFRELGRGQVFLSLSASYFIVFFVDKIMTNKSKDLSFIISVYIVLILSIISTHYLINKSLKYRTDNLHVSTVSLPDYQFMTNDDSEMTENQDEIESYDWDIDDDKQLIIGNYSISNIKRGYLSISFDYEKISNNNEVIEIPLPIVAYTGYKLYDNNVLTDFKNDMGKALITLNNNNGHIVFRFESNIRWKIALVISLASLLLAIIKRIFIEIKNINGVLNE